MTDPARRIEALKRQIRANPEKLRQGEEPRAIGEQAREALLKFDRRLNLLDSKYSDHRRDKLVRHCIWIAKNVRPNVLTESLSSRSAAEDIVL